jgi:hypothetical protein
MTLCENSRTTAAIARLRKHFDSIDEHVSGEVKALNRFPVEALNGQEAASKTP